MKRKTVDKEQLAVYISSSLAQRVKDKARVERRSISAVLQEVIERGLGRDTQSHLIRDHEFGCNLASKLPPFDNRWGEAQKQKWFDLFLSVLDKVK